MYMFRHRGVEIASNIPPQVKSKVGANLHLVPGHPIQLVKERLYGFFRKQYPDRFAMIDGLNPYVPVAQNFDELLIPEDHVSRSPSDTYYVDGDTVLRTHTSAHQTELLRSGIDNFLCTGPCFRRDTIDASHYPVFHQMEGVRVFDSLRPETEVAADMKQVLTELTQFLFGSDLQSSRWVDDHFPFTSPSWELEVEFQGQWLEVLGCGVIHPRVMEHGEISGRSGWAFGQGLDRLAMVLFQIPDIRLFWSEDERFLSQFRNIDPHDANLPKFVPFSVYPSTSRDVSFWLPPEYKAHDFFDTVRNIGGDLVEEVKEIDHFDDARSSRSAKCYRLVYRSMERTLETDEVNRLQQKIRDAVQDGLKGELR